MKRNLIILLVFILHEENYWPVSDIFKSASSITGDVNVVVDSVDGCITVSVTAVVIGTRLLSAPKSSVEPSRNTNYLTFAPMTTCNTTG